MCDETIYFSVLIANENAWDKHNLLHRCRSFHHYTCPSKMNKHNARIFRFIRMKNQLQHQLIFIDVFR